MRNPPSILFLIPYFGNWPFWMPFFVESCRHNPDIDWLLIGDCAEIPNLPPNVRHRHISFADYCAFIADRLGFAFAPPSPYKLCDLKPAFGHIHKGDLANYDFWAFGDLDLVYGDLRQYFTTERLSRYTLLATHDRRISGHLTLIRNTEEMCALYRKVPDFAALLANPAHQHFDESAFSRLFIWRKNLPNPLRRFISQFNPLWRNADFSEAYSTPYAARPWTDGSMAFPEYWTWKSGKLTSSKDGAREFPYLHFMSLKKEHWKNSPPIQDEIDDLVHSGCWRMGPFGFSACGEQK